MAEREFKPSRHPFGANVTVDVAVDTIPYPWDSFESFRSFHLKSTPTKAKQKYLAIVTHLTHHHALAEFDFNIPAIINEVLAKVMVCTGLSPAPPLVVDPQPSEQHCSYTQPIDGGVFQASNEIQRAQNFWTNDRSVTDRASPVALTRPCIEEQSTSSSMDLPPDVPMNGGHVRDDGQSVHRSRASQGRRSEARKSRAPSPLITAFKARRQTHSLSLPAQHVSFRPSRHPGPQPVTVTATATAHSSCREAGNRIEEPSNASTQSDATKTCDSDSEDTFVEVCVWSVRHRESRLADDQPRWEPSMSSAVDDAVACRMNFEDNEFPVDAPDAFPVNRHKMLMMVEQADMQHAFKWDVDAEEVGDWTADTCEEFSGIETTENTSSSLVALARSTDGRRNISSQHSVTKSYCSKTAPEPTHASSTLAAHRAYPLPSDSNDADISPMDYVRAERERYYRNMMVMPAKPKANRAMFSGQRRIVPAYFKALPREAFTSSTT